MIATVPLAGELSGLATSLLWSFSALAWSFAGRRVGAAPVTCIRIVLAAAVLAVVHWIMFGMPWPVGLSRREFWLLSVSGALGAGLGDYFLFHGYVLIGPRQGMLILSLSPVLATGMAYVGPLRECLGPVSLVGVAMTVGGVVWVVSDKSGHLAWRRASDGHGRGIVLALAGTTCIAGGFVLSKLGMGAPGAGGVDPFSATLVRVTAAMVFCWAALPLLGQLRSTLRSTRDGRAMGIMAAGTVVGPVIGIWLSMVAVKWAPTGVATALISTSPIMMIPISYFAYRERPTARTILGTVLAVAGVAILMLRGYLE